jgi:hypothetical protein
MDAVALKLSKFGGLSALRRARDLCLHLGAKMCIDAPGARTSPPPRRCIWARRPAAAVLNVCDLSGYVAPRLDPGGAGAPATAASPRPTAPASAYHPDAAMLGRLT